jgi:hypothetical protein
LKWKKIQTYKRVPYKKKHKGKKGDGTSGHAEGTIKVIKFEKLPVSFLFLSVAQQPKPA